MAYYLAVLKIQQEGVYAVGVYDSTTGRSDKDNSTIAWGFPDAISKLCIYAQQHPDFAEIRGSSLNVREDDAISHLESLLQSLRQTSAQSSKR